MSNFLFRLKSGHKGQSFVELAIVMMVLVGMFVGMVEAGSLLNQYINIVDGAREGARAGSSASPFVNSTLGNYSYDPNFYINIDKIIEGVLGLDGQLHDAAIAPLTLDPSPAVLDDVVISVFAVGTGNVTDTFPKYAELPAGHRIAGCNCWNAYGNRGTRITTSQINGLLVSAAPDSGILVVEIYYSYPAILKMPLNRIPVYTYAIMPLSAAEPTAVP
jgi:hypothetical protein